MLILAMHVAPSGGDAGGLRQIPQLLIGTHIIILG
jgi:hypothetical protein